MLVTSVIRNLPMYGQAIIWRSVPLSTTAAWDTRSYAMSKGVSSRVTRGTSNHADATRFMAAFASLSRTTPHCWQINTRSASVKSSCIHPQPEQVFEDGYQRDTNFTSTPASRALYSIWRRNSYKPTSATARLSLRFLSIPVMFKSSSTITAGLCSSSLVLATMAEVAL
jgi:hypothetical protein